MNLPEIREGQKVRLESWGRGEWVFVDRVLKDEPVFYGITERGSRVDFPIRRRWLPYQETAEV